MRKPGVFRVLNHHQPNFGSQRQRFAHDLVVQNRLAVIAQRHCASFLQCAIVAELFAQAPQCRRRHRKHVDHRAALLVLHPSRHCRRVVDRPRIRHRADGSKSARRRRRRSAGNVLLMRLSRLAQVHMQVDEARSHNQSFYVQRLIGPIRFARLGNLHHEAIAQHHVGRRIQPSRGVNQMSALQQHRAHRFPPNSVARIAMRTFTPFSTCSSTTDCPQSATSSVISMPRIIGPGCITIASCLASFSFAAVS